MAGTFGQSGSFFGVPNGLFGDLIPLVPPKPADWGYTFGQSGGLFGALGGTFGGQANPIQPQPALYPKLSFLETILAPTTRVTRRAEIYEPDGVTLWYADPPLVAGSVSVQQDRDERRTLDISFNNQLGRLDHYPEGFWYDKIIKVFRGAISPDGTPWETQIGEFMIDAIEAPSFPSNIHVTGRDYTKKLILSSFPRATSFPPNLAIEEVIRTIAVNGGITKFLLPTTGKVLGTSEDFTFDAGTTRWDAIKKIADAFSFEIFFNPQGFMVLAPFEDPTTSGLWFTFKTGEPDGNLATPWTKSTNDTRIKNHVVVIGQRQDLPPIVAEAVNNNPMSPTNVARLGDRIYEYKSELIETDAQAQTLANDLLKVMALESFDVSINSLVIPWLEVGRIVGFLDPSPSPGDPNRYLLSEFDIPLMLGAQSSRAKRVTIVG